MEDPNVVEKFAAISIKTYIPVLKYVCAFVLPFWSCRVLIGLHAKEKCACDQFTNGCVQVCVCRLVYVED